MHKDANIQQDAAATEKMAWQKPALTQLDARMSDIAGGGGGGADSIESSFTTTVPPS